MSEQTGKSRTIKTIPQGSLPPAIEPLTIYNQYCQIMQKLANLEELMIGNSEMLATQSSKQQVVEPIIVKPKIERSIPHWEKTERAAREEPIKEKSGKGTVLLVLFFVIMLVILIGFFLRSQGWVFFWQQ